jgi:hypothetical protein
MEADEPACGLSPSVFKPAVPFAELPFSFFFVQYACWLHVGISSRTYHQHILISDVVANASMSIYLSIYLHIYVHLYIYHVSNIEIFMSAAAWTDLITYLMLIQSSSSD